MNKEEIKIPTNLKVYYKWNEVVAIATTFFEAVFTALPH